MKIIETTKQIVQVNNKQNLHFDLSSVKIK